jgi:dihydrofolate synthase/folylpolyglutamate synthase
MQRLRSGPLADLLPAEAELWLDGGHNQAGGAAIAQTIADLDERVPKPVTLIVGMLGTKDADGFLAPFRGLVRDVICVPVEGEHEVRRPEDLAGIAARLALSTRIAPDVPAALRMARQAGDAPRVVICGSLYLAGQVLALNQAR